MRVAFKPTATIAQAQETVTDQGEAAILEAKGRHDPCVLPRAVPMVEAMVALVLADALLERFAADSIAALDRAMASAEEALRTRFARRPQTT